MEAYDRREAELGPELVRDLEALGAHGFIDQHWREHLYNMDYLREGIHLRALGQKDPLSEYLEGHGMFDEMMDTVKAEFVRYMFHIQVDGPPRPRSRRSPTSTTRTRQTHSRASSRSSPRPRVARNPRWRPRKRRGSVAVVEQRVLSDDQRSAATTHAPAARASTSAATRRGGRRTAPPGLEAPMSTEPTLSLDDLVQRALTPSREGRRPGRLPLTRRPSSAGWPSSSARWARRASGTTRPARPRSPRSTPPPPAAERLSAAHRGGLLARGDGGAPERGAGVGRARHRPAGGLADGIAEAGRLGGLEEARLFSGEHDGGDALVTINAGEGGTDAQDWAEMLLRMYLRWAERRGLRTDLKEVQEGAGPTSSRRPSPPTARTPTACCRPSGACTGWCGYPRSTAAARPRSPRSTSRPSSTSP